MRRTGDVWAGFLCGALAATWLAILIWLSARNRRW